MPDGVVADEFLVDEISGEVLQLFRELMLRAVAPEIHMQLPAENVHLLLSGAVFHCCNIFEAASTRSVKPG